MSVTSKKPTASPSRNTPAPTRSGVYVGNVNSNAKIFPKFFAGAELSAAEVSKIRNQIGDSVEKEAAEKLVQEVDPADVKRLCERYGMRREDLGRLTGFSLRALADWSAGKLPSEPAKRRLHEIRRLLDALAHVVKPEAIAPWLKARNAAFENMTPMQVIEVGEIDRLWQMVHHLSSDSVD
jgi:DNA-binding transcriptional regulator YiaG